MTRNCLCSFRKLVTTHAPGVRWILGQALGEGDSLLFRNNNRPLLGFYIGDAVSPCFCGNTGEIVQGSAFPRSVLPCVFVQAGPLVKDSQLIVSRETVDGIAEPVWRCLICSLEEISNL